MIAIIIDVALNYKKQTGPLTAQKQFPFILILSSVLGMYTVCFV